MHLFHSARLALLHISAYRVKSNFITMRRFVCEARTAR